MDDLNECVEARNVSRLCEPTLLAACRTKVKDFEHALFFKMETVFWKETRVHIGMAL